MIAQALCTSFKAEILRGIHDFTSHTFKIALYTSDASLGAATTAYTTTGEVTGTGYVAGGATLTVTGGEVSTSGTVAFVDFEDASWPSSTLTARGALIYNDTVSGDPPVAVLDFGMDKSVTGATFTVQFPVADAESAIVRIE